MTAPVDDGHRKGFTSSLVKHLKHILVNQNLNFIESGVHLAPELLLRSVYRSSTSLRIRGEDIKKLLLSPGSLMCPLYVEATTI